MWNEPASPAWTAGGGEGGNWRALSLAYVHLNLIIAVLHSTLQNLYNFRIEQKDYLLIDGLSQIGNPDEKMLPS
jgi:hypothetical protein